MIPAKDLSRSDWIKQFTAGGSDYEIVSGEVWGRKCRVFKNAPANLRTLFEDARSGETFLVYGNERYTFEETFQSSACIASILIEQYSIQKGDRVALCLRNYPEWVMLFNAITSIGAIAVAMNALWISDELAYGLGDSGAKLLFADQERLDRLMPVYNNLDIQVIGVRPQKTLPVDIPDLAKLMAIRITKSDTVEMPSVVVQGTDPATIFYTSGSTDHPKGVLSCHTNIITALLSWELDRKIHEAMLNFSPEAPPYQPAGLLAIPLFHVTGSHAVMLSSYRSQRKMVSMYKWDAAEAAKLIEIEKISSFTAPAAMTGDLVETGKLTRRDLSSLVAVGGGGAPRAPEQVKNIATSFTNALPNTGWGMTETNAIGTGIGGQDYLAHPGSSGRCSAVLDIRIMDKSNTDMPTGERGEILIRGSSIFEGYWNRPEANAEVFVDDWLRTGDVGYVDEEGYLYIVDRIKDLVIRGGENIGCAEVEAALLSHASILEASVYAVPDARLGEEVGASLYCSGSISETDLRLFLRTRLAAFKIPRYIQFCEAPLPRIASGKINKRQIREAAIARLGTV